MLPAWLGTDAAFEEKLTGKERHIMQEMIEEWPFFQTQVNMLEMVLSKTDIEISSRYDEHLVPKHLQPLGNELRQRLANLIARVNELKNQDMLLAEAPEIRQTLDLRHPYTDPLHRLQIELLKRCRESSNAQQEEAQKALLVTIAGIAASMRNTG